MKNNEKNNGEKKGMKLNWFYYSLFCSAIPIIIRGILWIIFYKTNSLVYSVSDIFGFSLAFCLSMINEILNLKKDCNLIYYSYTTYFIVIALVLIVSPLGIGLVILPEFTEMKAANQTILFIFSIVLAAFLLRFGWFLNKEGGEEIVNN